MVEVPKELRLRLKQIGQDHVLAFWPRLDDAARSDLIVQLEALDLEELARLYAKRDDKHALPSPERIQPIPRADAALRDESLKDLADKAYRAGEVAVLVVAGGQGSRLGFEHPKGMFPVGPVSRKSLFQIHAEKVLALRRRYGQRVPYLVKTSPATHDETVGSFAATAHFG